MTHIASGHPQTLNPEEQPLLHVSCRQISHQLFRGDGRTASSTEKSFAENKLKASKPKMNYLNRIISFRSFFFFSKLNNILLYPYLIHVNFYFQTSFDTLVRGHNLSIYRNQIRTTGGYDINVLIVHKSIFPQKC